MGWDGYTFIISVAVDSHGGERQERGERLYEQFQKRLGALCEEFSRDEEALRVMF